MNNAPFVTACCFNETSIHYNEEKYEECKERFVLPTNLIIQTTSSPENFSISSGTEMEDMVQIINCSIYVVAEGSVRLSPDSSPSVPSTPKATDTVVKETISPKQYAYSFVCSCVSSVLGCMVGFKGIGAAYQSASIESAESTYSNSSTNIDKSPKSVSSVLSSIIDNLKIPLLLTGFAIVANAFFKGSK